MRPHSLPGNPSAAGMPIWNGSGGTGNRVRRATSGASSAVATAGRAGGSATYVPAGPDATTSSSSVSRS